MSTRTQAPAAAGATTGRRVAAQARYEIRTLLSNGEQLLVSLVLPALALVGMALARQPDLGPERRIDLVVPSVLGLAVVSTAFTGQAIATGFDRRYGVLRVLGTTPLGRAGLLAGKALAVLAVVALQTVVLAAIGFALGWRPHLPGTLAAVALLVLGSATWVSLAMLLAGSLRAEAVLAVANLVWVLVAAVGGLLVPTDRLGAFGPVARLLPSGALGDGLRDALTGHPGAMWGPVLVLVIWGVLAAALAARTFRWGD